MPRSYEYRGFTLDVSVEVDVNIRPARRALTQLAYVAVVRISRDRDALAIISPLRFGETCGRPFSTEADALMGGFSAACKIVDDLFPQDRR